MKVLTKYSKSKNITNINNVTQTEYLKALSNNKKVVAPEDYNNPYNFEEWYNRNLGVISGNEHLQYNEYLKNWYTSRYTQETILSDLRKDYISFLQNLTLVMDKTDKSNWLVDINWNDQLEVEQAIPFYARKLKEIALYLVNKRDSIKRAKLKYNMTGATHALDKLFYEYLLKAFTKRDYIMNVPDQPTFANFPTLSSVKTGFQIQVEELYDDTMYLDKDPSLSASDYFSTVTQESTAYYDSIGISPSAYEWFFSTGFAPLCSDNPLFWVMGSVLTNDLPLSAYDYSDTGLVNEYYKFKLTQKYIGEAQYYLSGGYYIPWKKELNYDLIKGNNLFYWPTGEFIEELNDAKYDPLPLVSSTLIESGANGSENYLLADKIFIKYGETVSGAWLKHIEQTTVTDIMSADLIEGLNVFKFPFPGYGVSGEDIEWNGKQLSNLDKTFDYLSKDIQNDIKSQYWNTITTVSTLCTIPLYETSLIDDGAYASKTYDNADKITIRLNTSIDNVHDSKNDGVYQGDSQHAWLYKFDTTDIPISRDQNYIHWPLYRYDKKSTSFIDILTSQVAPIRLSSINGDNIIGSRAGSNLFDSDILYKLDSRDGSPIECAFLSGASLDAFGGTTYTFGATGAIQTALTMKCKPGEYSTFIWTDDDTDISDTNINNVRHQSDCPYVFLHHHSIYKENPQDNKSDIDYKQWEKCECRAINYSPLGHIGSTYDDYHNMADIIYLDTLHPLPFSLNNWVGLDGNDYRTSEDFAWFRVNPNTKVEPDVGWGAGEWVAGGVPLSSRKFILKKGYQYKYLRSGVGHSDTFLAEGTMPYLIIKQKYGNISEPIWMKAIADQNGSWQIDGDVTDMVIKAGEYLVYDHIDSNWYCITGIGDLDSTLVYNTSAKNINNNIWMNYNLVTSGQNIRLLWPDSLHSSGPTVLAFQLSSVTWNVTLPTSQTLSYNKSPDDALVIYADKIGNWSVNATGYYINGGSATYNGVGNFVVSPLLATPTLTGSTEIQTIYCDTINMSMNAKVSGWNYTTHTYDGSSNGGRPFWAYASDKDDKITKHKGIDKWGGGVQVFDDYTLITQPASSDIFLSTDLYLEYFAKNNLVWKEVLTFSKVQSSNQWCDLIIDTNKVSNLSSYLYNINEEIVISATDRSSQIVLNNKIDEKPVLVNYWATQPFIWKEYLTDSSLGLPPTGGVFVPITSGLLSQPNEPYLNLVNRHFPTIATVPHVEQLYSVDDVGGYYTPRMIGTTTFLSRNLKNVLDTSRLLTNNVNRGVSAIFQNIDIYLPDNGLTQREQFSPVSGLSVDSSWLKADITQERFSGVIVNPAEQQEFIPYHTKYETQKVNNIGIRRQGDKFDPWGNNFDDKWENEVNWAGDFRGQHHLSAYEAQFETEKQIYQWFTDIFDNNYALFKTLTGQSLIQKRDQYGDLWTRDVNGFVQPANISLSGMFENFKLVAQTPTLSTEMYNIKNFAIWFDVIMLQTPNYILLNKITFDYDTGISSFDANNMHIINLTDNNTTVNKYAGSWFFENEKDVTLAVLVSSVSSIYPRLYSLDINTNKLKYIYNEQTTDTNQLSTLSLTSIQQPVFTYNNVTQNYNMCFICKSPIYQSYMITSMNIVDSGDIHYIDKISVITPLE